MITVRAMAAGDHAAVARVWHEAWHDGHGSLLPESLLRIRGPEVFAKAVPALAHPAHVAEKDSAILGFVGFDGAMIEKLFVSRAGRGTGAASALMAAAEAAMRAAGHQTAVLDYVAGNDRAARFYAREGWRIVREEDDALDTPDGPVTYKSVICEKALGP